MPPTPPRSKGLLPSLSITTTATPVIINCSNRGERYFIKSKVTRASKEICSINIFLQFKRFGKKKNLEIWLKNLQLRNSYSLNSPIESLTMLLTKKSLLQTLHSYKCQSVMTLLLTLITGQENWIPSIDQVELRPLLHHLQQRIQRSNRKIWRGGKRS